jgi:hypothetical protein
VIKSLLFFFFHRFRTVFLRVKTITAFETKQIEIFLIHLGLIRPPLTTVGDMKFLSAQSTPKHLWFSQVIWAGTETPPCTTELAKQASISSLLFWWLL